MKFDSELNVDLLRHQVGTIEGSIQASIKIWETAAWQFISSYEVALLRFKSTIEKQEEIERKAVDYAFTALALAGGNLLTATIAKGIEGYIYDKSLSFVCKNNLETIFNRVYSNESVRSIIGGAVKKGEDALLQSVVNTIKENVRQYKYKNEPSKNSSICVLSGMMTYVANKGETLRRAIRVSANAYINAVGTNFEQRRLADYNNMISEIINCKFMFPPDIDAVSSAGGQFSEQRAARVQEKIELSMYLARLMDTDVLVQRYMNSPAIKKTHVRTSINYSPSQIGYPNTLPERIDAYNNTGLIEQKVVYSSYGSKVAEELNRLANKIYNQGNIVEVTAWTGSRPSRESLVKAENLANILGQPYHQPFVGSDRPILTRDSGLFGLTEAQKKVIKQNSKY
ncbi:hypothetical protein [Hahella sp. HN01]|uniref:hypothetical protein n=1 Tax=Hahella sp. HN01 TaxID=2847262 RepID=UPI001C1EB632|nr:hypothetical protein [Hahella sp. HN01]MBU6951407.1 hypothetical protein [Hahella sp. HN01]